MSFSWLVLLQQNQACGPLLSRGATVGRVRPRCYRLLWVQLGVTQPVSHQGSSREQVSTNRLQTRICSAQLANKSLLAALPADAAALLSHS